MSYHLLAADRPRWRHLVGILVIVAGWLIAAGAVHAAGAVAVEPAGGEYPRFTLALDFAMVATLLPATWFTVRVLQGRGLGTLSSVAGRLRWGWLGRSALVAAPVVGLIAASGWLLDPEAGPWARPGEVVRTLAALVLLVPIQAAAEEYAFRGYLLQAFSSLRKHPRTLYGWWATPWVPILTQAVLFAALHGWGTPWGFADLVVFGAVAGWLTVRTGGLEAAVALHVLNNLAAVAQMAVLGDLRLDETAADLPWPMVAVDVPLLVLYAVVIARLAPPAAARSATSQGPAGGDSAELGDAVQRELRDDLGTASRSTATLPTSQMKG